jgi:hypothetical protein
MPTLRDPALRPIASLPSIHRPASNNQPRRHQGTTKRTIPSWKRSRGVKVAGTLRVPSAYAAHRTAVPQRTALGECLLREATARERRVSSSFVPLCLGGKHLVNIKLVRPGCTLAQCSPEISDVPFSCPRFAPLQYFSTVNEWQRIFL